MREFFRKFYLFLRRMLGRRPVNSTGDVSSGGYRHPSYSGNLEELTREVDKGHYCYLPHLFCILIEESDSHKLAVAQVLKRCLDSAAPSKIHRIEYQMRESGSAGWGIDWKKFNIENFFTEQMAVDEKRAIAIFSSFHLNGYLREKSIAHLRLFPGTLPYIISRTNDWVPQVRRAADAAFHERIAIVNDAELVDSLPVLEKLRRFGRVNVASLADAVNAKIRSPEGQKILKKGLSSDDVHVRGVCIRAVFDAGVESLFPVMDVLENEKDPFLRKLFFKGIAGIGLASDEICKKFIHDGFAQNRASALQYMYDHNVDGTLDHATEKIFDKSALVRDVSRKILSQSGQSIDFRKEYIDGLCNKTFASICGIGEVGRPDDGKIIENYLHDDRISFVKATILALARLDASGYDIEITEKLLSAHHGIVGVSQYVIEKYKIYNFDRIFEIYNASDVENTKMKCARLLFKASKWKRLIYMLLLLDSNNKKVVDFSLLSMSAWYDSYNRSYVQVSDEDRDTIVKLIDANKNKFSHTSTLMDRIRFLTS